MSPVPDLTDTCYKFAPANLSGRYGVSVRAVAVRDGTSDRLRVMPRRVDPPRVTDPRPHGEKLRRATAQPHTRTGWWRWIDDDRRLIRLKMMMLGTIVLMAALLEVQL